MSTRIILAGTTGWVGRALVAAIAQSSDLALVGAVARSAAGQDAGEAAGLAPLGVKISAKLGDALATPCDVVIDYTKPDVVKHHVLQALATPCDVVIDYTKPDVVKHHVLQALAHGCHVVIGTSGLSAEDYAKIDTAAKEKGRGVVAAGNFSLTATLMRRFALEAARLVPDVEIIDYASAGKADTPSGTARELAEMLGEVRRAGTAKPVAELAGVRETRGGAIGRPTPVQVHSVRMPSYLLSCEVVLGADNERLTIRHDAGASAAPYVAGTLLAARRVGSFVGLRRGLDAVLG